jgi:hypothetical protein
MQALGREREEIAVLMNCTPLHRRTPSQTAAIAFSNPRGAVDLLGEKMFP